MDGVDGKKIGPLSPLWGPFSPCEGGLSSPYGEYFGHSSPYKKNKINASCNVLTTIQKSFKLTFKKSWE